MKRIGNRLAQSVLIMFLVSILCFALTKGSSGRSGHDVCGTEYERGIY